MNTDRRGVLVGFVAYLFWGLITIYWKALHHFDAFELIGHRVVWSVVLMAALLTITRRWAAVARALRTPRTLAILVASALLLTCNWTCYVYAVVHGHVVETALGYFMAPIGTMCIGVLAMKESLHRAQRIALVFAVAAVVVLTVAYGRVPWLALGLGASWTAYVYLKRLVPLHPVESFAGETAVVFIPALVLVVAHQASGSGALQTGSTRDVVLVLLSGIATAVPLVMFAYAAKRVPFTILGPLNYLVPSINFLLGVLAYHERLTTTRVVGFALVWVALAIMTIDMVRRPLPAPPTAAADRC
jgi:chloramphenicol-sensitive protein RarD